MHEIYKNSRKKCGLSIEEAAFRISISPRTLINYELGNTIPSSDTVLAMSKVYKQPFLTQLYCNKCCDIGKAYTYVPLDNVNLSIESVLLSLNEEASEAMEMLPDILKLIRNKRSRSDFVDSDWKWFIRGIQQWLDLEHNIECIRMSLDKFADMETLVREHNDKCCKKHYSLISR